MVYQTASYLGGAALSGLGFVAQSAMQNRTFREALAGSIVGHVVNEKFLGDVPEDPVVSSLIAVPVSVGISALNCYVNGSSYAWMAAAAVTTLALEFLPERVGLPPNALANGVVKVATGTASLALTVHSYLTAEPKQTQVQLAAKPKTSNYDEKIERLEKEISQLRQEYATLATALKDKKREIREFESDNEALEAENALLRKQIETLKTALQAIPETPRRSARLAARQTATQKAISK